LRRLLGDAVSLTVVAPNDELVYRPLAVREPFAFRSARRYRLRQLAGDTDAEWVKDTLEWVDPQGQKIHTGAGQALPYDALLVAIGARKEAVYEHATAFDDAEADATFEGIVQDIEGGYTKELALLVPEGPTWPLPVYELALMTAERARGMGMDDLQVSVVTPEPAPLSAFGDAASEALSERLELSNITLYPSATAEVPAAGHVVVQPQGLELQPDRIVSIPRVTGQHVRGLPEEHGFIPIDNACRIPGAGDQAFAAGDATNFQVKHGGLGAQQADVAAAGIARLLGVAAEPAALEPVIRGILLTGKEPLYLTARLVGARGFESEVSDQPSWDPPEKVAAEELGPYLAELDKQAEHE
jgi:sulfide:quinone oxidoreductase